MTRCELLGSGPGSNQNVVAPECERRVGLTNAGECIAHAAKLVGGREALGRTLQRTMRIGGGFPTSSRYPAQAALSASA